jgi:hypothetical protein
MTTTYAERTTQALTISELISAMAEVQKLIANHDENCHLGILTIKELGSAYYRLAELLDRTTRKMVYGF